MRREILDIPKALSFENDLLELETSADKDASIDHEVHVGMVTNVSDMTNIPCNGKAVSFSTIEKLAFDSKNRDKGAIIFFTLNPRVPSALEKVEDCKLDGLPPLKFKDIKSGKLLEEKFSDIVDYVPNINPPPGHRRRTEMRSVSRITADAKGRRRSDKALLLKSPGLHSRSP